VSKAADRLLSSKNSLTVLLLTAAARCKVRFIDLPFSLTKSIDRAGRGPALDQI
jgi:hypothetical protein